MRSLSGKLGLYGASLLAISVGLGVVQARAETAPAAAAQQVAFNVPAGDLGPALTAFARQANQEILFTSALVAGRRTAGVQGRYAPSDALQVILHDTGLEVASRQGSVITLRATADTTAALLPEVLVSGGGSLNTDVRRSEDDILPYVVFGREEIQRSQAVNVEDFLSSRLTMVTGRGNGSRNDLGNSISGNRSSINLRGLGANQTLILVNGRRAAGVLPSPGADLAQPDVNGIPIASIERIEILPGSASGIYGGGATGGVINIILRKDYTGTEVRVTYGNTFDTDSARRRVDLSSGFTLEDGRTQIMVTGSYSDGNQLLVQDRDFIVPARDAALRNAPAWFIQNASIASNRTNFRSTAGDLLILSNGTPYGFSYGSVPLNYTGGDAGAGLLAGAGNYDLTLPVGVSGERGSLTAIPENQSINLTIRRDMTDAVEAYLDLTATRTRSVIQQGSRVNPITLPANSVGNPFRNRISVSLPDSGFDTETVSITGTQRVNAGIIADLGRDWSAGLDANYNRATSGYDRAVSTVDSNLVLAAVRAGQLNIFRDLSLYPIDYTPYLALAEGHVPSSPTYTYDFSARAAGPILTLPAGQVRVTGLLSHRRDMAPGLLQRFSNSDDYVYFHPRSQIVQSAYLEGVVPLIDAPQNVPFVRSLEGQISVRYDNYRTTTSPSVDVAGPDAPRPDPAEVTNTLESTDYTVGVKYTPFNGVFVRASYATGFLPPSLTQLFGFSFDLDNFVADPLRGNTVSETIFLYTTGGNPDAKPERSTSRSVGLVLSPTWMEGVRLSLDYTKIAKTDELVSLTPLQILQNEALLPGRVVRGERLPGDPSSYAGVVTALNASLVNIATSRVEAFDLQLDYETSIGDLGLFRFYSAATLQTQLAQQVSESSPVVDRIGFSDGPGEWRFNVGLDWERGPWSAAVNTQFYDGYRVFTSTASASSRIQTAQIQGSPSINAQNYTDLSARYIAEDGWLAGTEFSVGIQNLFNQKPPVLATGNLTGGYSTFADPRLRSYSISVRRAF